MDSLQTFVESPLESEDVYYFDLIQAMNYSDDIEMWDFEQILDNSPLSALTADFARFKQRFSKIFDSNSSIPSADSDSETTSMTSNISRTNRIMAQDKVSLV